jgi:hypothetical protein
MRHKNRSYLSIDKKDLKRLARIAEADRKDLFDRLPHLLPMSKLLFCVALCQGAGLHYVNGTNGVKDFDVWSFYRADPKYTFPARRIINRDFRDKKFGRSPDRPDYIGRRVDLIGRSITCFPEDTLVAALRRWLQSSGHSPKLLSQKAVVLLWPSNLLGVIAWRPGSGW